MESLLKITKQGGIVASNARKEIIRKKVVTNKNAIELRINKKLK